MTNYPLDIIIPVWNRPVEVRSALASFVADSPMARIIMVNNGSERETESILDEFAEALDDRALLVASSRNIGTVAAINLGISRSSAEFVLIANPFTRVKSGWFDPVADYFARNTGAGALVLRNERASSAFTPIETDHGSFDAMIVRRDLCSAVGEFDDSMDGGEWALRDFARRSLVHGYTTLSLVSRHLDLLEYKEMGSLARREDRSRLARETYLSRWGAYDKYFIHCTDDLLGGGIDALKGALLKSARQGDQITFAADSAVSKTFLLHGFSSIHENISFHPLPRFFPGRTLNRLLQKTAAKEPATIFISDADFHGADLPKLSFKDFTERSEKREQLYYQKGGV